MRISTFIILLAITAYFIQGFNQPKCEHVFTTVEQATATIDQPTAGYSVVLPIYSRPTGLHEGKELVCVKCFHKQKQIMDYGQPMCPSFPTFDSTFKFLTAGGSILTISSGGLHYIKGDTLFKTN